jgi:hypothetical protein
MFSFQSIHDPLRSTTAKKSKQILRLVSAVSKLVCINAERSKIQSS